MMQRFDAPLDSLSRRWPWIAGSALAGLVCAATAAFLLPDEFASFAIVQVAPPQVSPRLVTPAAASTLGETLTAFQQSLLNRGVLASLIETHSLYPSDKAAVPMEDLIERFRKSVMITPTAMPGARTNAPAFQVSFTYSDRYKAQRVTADLLSRLIDKGVRTSKDGAEGAASFLKSQADEAAERTRAVERELEAAERRREPDSEEARRERRSELALAEQELRSLDAAIRAAERERAEWSAEAEAPAKPKAVAANTPAAKRIEVIDAERAALTRTRDQLLARYTASHPDVLQIDARLRALPPATVVETPDPAPAATPPAQQISDTGEATRVRASRRAQTLRAESDRLTRERERTAARIEELRARLGGPAASGGEIDRLRHQLANARRWEDELRRKFEEAELGRRLQDGQRGETMEVIESASLPEAPIAPNRPLIILGGLITGILAGAGLAFWRDHRDGAVHTISALKEMLSMPLLAAVPLIESDTAVMARRRRDVLIWVHAGLLGAGAVLLAAWRYHSTLR